MRNDSENPTKQSQATAFPSASLLDNLRVNLFHVLPYYLRGIFTRNRCLSQLLAWLRLHPFSVRFCNRLKRKYRSNYLYINMLGRKTLLVLDLEGVRHILDQSPQIYAEVRLKHRGMSHFQPNAVTISRGEAWSNRRRFNEDVLAGGETVHPDAVEFLDIIRREVAANAFSTWDEFAVVFERITLGVLFGDPEETRLTRDLTTMMKESNCVFFLKKSKHYDRFNHAIRRHLHTPRTHTLAARCAHASVAPLTKADNQVPHWIFAMNETLASNVVRALALIVAHPQTEIRVREEMSGADLSTPTGVDSLQYLEGCVQEAMRLWPSIQLLVRESIRRDRLGGVIVPARTQVLIPNTFHHRNTQHRSEANRFRPEIWSGRKIHYAYNHLSNGPQVCAGKALVLFMAKAVLACMLENRRYVLTRPTLNPAKSLPYSLNKYRLRFKQTKIDRWALD